MRAAAFSVVPRGGQLARPAAAAHVLPRMRRQDQRESVLGAEQSPFDRADALLQVEVESGPLACACVPEHRVAADDACDQLEGERRLAVAGVADDDGALASTDERPCQVGGRVRVGPRHIVLRGLRRESEGRRRLRALSRPGRDGFRQLRRREDPEVQTVCGIGSVASSLLACDAEVGRGRLPAGHARSSHHEATAVPAAEVAVATRVDCRTARSTSATPRARRHTWLCRRPGHCR
jgi:hypothetical protein